MISLGVITINAFELAEKYNDLIMKSNKIKKLQSALKGNTEVDDCVDVLKDISKDLTDNSSCIKKILSEIEIDNFKNDSCN